MEKNYEYKINPGIDLSKQYISKEANEILISIFRDYFANDRQRRILNDLLNQNQKKLENIKREKYNSDNIFRNNNKNAIVDNAEKERKIALIEIKEMKWYKKIWRFLTNFFKNKIKPNKFKNSIEQN